MESLDKDIPIIKQLKQIAVVLKFQSASQIDNFFETDRDLTALVIEKEALSYYNRNDYQNSLKVIITYITLFYEINDQTIKLLVANLQCLGCMVTARHAYLKIYQFNNQEIDCIYFAGVCAFFTGDKDDGKKLLTRFLTFRSNRKQAIIYRRYFEHSEKLIKLL